MKSISTFTFKDIQGFRFGSSIYGRPSFFVHVYFVDELLIDTGHVNMRNQIANVLKPLPVDQMLITHHHEDHSGNIERLQELFNCPVFASAECVRLMKDPPPISPAQYFSWGKYDAYYNFEVVDDQIRTPKYVFDIIPIPGHAADMIALHEPNQGWLFSADLYVHHRIKYFMRAESMMQQIESIRKILKLDFDQMFCSHNPIIDGDPKTLLKKKLNFLESFYDQVVLLHDQGHLPPDIMRNMNFDESWYVKLFSLGALSGLNMVSSVLRDERNKL